jgi:hypothetical protein
MGSYSQAQWKPLHQVKADGPKDPEMEVCRFSGPGQNAGWVPGEYSRKECYLRATL